MSSNAVPLTVEIGPICDYLPEICDIIRIAKWTLLWGNFQNPFLSGDIIP